MKNLIFVLLSMSLIACSGAIKTVKTDFKLDSNYKNGFAVSSIKYQGGFASYSVFLRSLDGTYSEELQLGSGVSLIPMHPESDFKFERGQLSTLELPPGDYEFYRWSVHSGSAFTDNSKPFQVKFTIEPGKATYVGSFKFVQTSSFGLTVTGAKVEYRDDSEKDFLVLKKKYPGIPTDKIIMGIEKTRNKKT